MMILVTKSPNHLAPYRTPELGILVSPRKIPADLDGWTWAADNDAFGAWDEERYIVMLDKLAGRPGCLFVTVPDVLGDARATRDRFHHWIDHLDDRDLPAALVAQDGLTVDDPIPWSRITALFIGGTTEFKLGPEAKALVKWAHRQGRWVHMGRVNTERRARYARWIGCDSADGSAFSWYTRTYLQRHLNSQAQGMWLEGSTPGEQSVDTPPRRRL